MGEQRLKVAKALSVGCVLLLLLLTGSAKSVRGEDDTAAADGNSRTGELKIEGKGVRRLILNTNEGKRKEIEGPGERLRLTAGKYTLHEIHLEGGYVCYCWRDPDRKAITVDEDKPGVLKAGAPLKQNVQVKRQGRLLVMSYELLGIGGEQYARQSRDNPPKFAIYKGQEKIGDGSFEYG
jgi:hypothetical protein